MGASDNDLFQFESTRPIELEFGPEVPDKTEAVRNKLGLGIGKVRGLSVRVSVQIAMGSDE